MRQESKINIFGILGIVALTALSTPLKAEERGITDSQITIGSHLPMSGPLASWGTQVANGLRMRFDEENAAGGIHGRQIKLIVEDNEFNPAKAAQAGNKLIERDNVFAIIGSLGTPTNLVVMPIAFDANVPNLFPFAAGRQMSEPFNRLGFALFTPHYDNMRAAIKFFVDERGKSRVCTLSQDNEFGAEVKAGVVDQLEAMNLELVAAQTHSARDKDFSNQILSLREAKCDLIALGGVVLDTILPMGTARRMGWDVEFVGSSSSYAPENISLAKGATDGLYATGQMEIPDAESGNDRAKAFVKTYEATHGSLPGYQAAMAYTLADVFIRAATAGGKDLNLEAFLNALENISDYNDPFESGPVLSFTQEDHLATKSTFISQVQDGQWRKITDILSY